MAFLAPIAVGIGVAIKGAISFLASGTLASQLVLGGLSIAARYALSTFFDPKSPPAQASKLETQYGEKLAREIAQSTVGTAGHHIYRNAYGKGNRIVQDVYVLSHFNIHGVSRVRYKGDWKTIGGAVDAERGQRIQGIDAEVWVKIYTGTMDQAADAGLIARSNPPGRWTENHRGAGVAYAVVTSVLHRERLPQPWEAFFEVVGVTYDWRKDDTVGGAGTHRWNDPATWAPTTNPVLIMYALTRGFWRGAEKIAGKGRPASELPLSHWTLAANICDEIVAGKRRYQAAAILSSGEGTTHDSNLQPLLEACAGSWLELAGQEYPIVGANQTPVTVFTDDDMVVDEAFRYSAKRTRSELVNTVAGTYVDPSSFYQAMPLATRIDEVALAADGERLAVPLSFSAVTVPECVDRLADIALRASRYQGSAELWLRPKYLGLKPGQWVTWHSAKFGWTKQFQVLSKRLGAFGPKGTRNVFLSLQEVGAGIFDPTEYVTVPPDGIVQGAPEYLAEIENLRLSGIKVEDPETGNQYPAIRAAWDAIGDPTVVGVDIRYRPKSQPDAILYHPTVPDDVTIATIADGVVSSTVFEVSTRLMTSPYRVTFWSAWQEVTTPNAPRTDVSVYLKSVGEDVYRTLEHYRAEMDDLRAQLRLLADGSDEVAGRVADERHVAVGFRDAAAVAMQAMSASITEMEGDLSAQASIVSAVQAAVGNISADGLRKVEVQAGAGDVVARLVDMVRATIDDVWVEAGTIVEVGFEGGDPSKPFSNYIMMGRRVMFMDDAGDVFALFGPDGLTIENARLGTLEFDQLQSSNAKLVIHGTGEEAYIEMSS